MLCGTIIQLVTERDRRLVASAANDDSMDMDIPPKELVEVQRQVVHVSLTLSHRILTIFLISGVVITIINRSWSWPS